MKAEKTKHRKGNKVWVKKDLSAGFIFQLKQSEKSKMVHVPKRNEFGNQNMGSQNMSKMVKNIF